MNRVASHGLALLCCGVQSFGQIPYEWFEQDSSGTNDLNAITCARIFVAAGNRSTILISTNGKDWVAGSAGVSEVDFRCVSPGSPYVLIGGSGAALICSSSDAINWTNGYPGTGSEQALGITYYLGTNYCIVGNSNSNTTYMLSSWNGRDWSSNSLPTTNTLFAIARAIGPSGRALSGAVLVAVGDNGTILTSTNGRAWILRDSGTTAALRTAVYHNGRVLVGGDAGVLLSSADGIQWSAIRPLAFDIHGLASSGEAVAAVGSSSGSGRIQVSIDGLNWSGNPLVFSKALNGVAYGASMFVAVGAGGLIVQSSYAPNCPDNSWTKTINGYWEEDFWSCGQLPTADQPTIEFTNAGSKVLAIGPATIANLPGSMVLSHLIVNAPTSSFNQLLLDHAGTNAASLTASRLSVGDNASLASYASSLNISLGEISSALFAEGSSLQADSLYVSSLTFVNSHASINRLYAGGLTQFGGTLSIYASVMEAGSSINLYDGTIEGHELCLQANPDFSVGGSSFINGTASFMQSGGQATFDVITLGNFAGYGNQRGEIALASGMLSGSRLVVYSGAFNQTGGTNICVSLALPAQVSFGGIFYAPAVYSLSGGVLVSGGVSLGFAGSMNFNPRGNFYQTGGLHINQGISLIGYYEASVSPGGPVMLERSGSYYQSGGELWSDSVYVPGGYFSQDGGTSHINQLHVGRDGLYEFGSGTLLTESIEIGPNGVLSCGEGVITNSGTFTIQGGTFRAGDQSHELGQLAVLGVTNCYCSLGRDAFTLNVGGWGDTVLRFFDSSAVAWTGSLKIFGWQPAGSDSDAHRIFFGTNADGLTQAQLAALTFVDPLGWPRGNYPARILSTGEIMPAEPPLLRADIIANGLVLSWPGEYDLVAATNIFGPYESIPNAHSPFTNIFADPARFFRLRSPGP